MLGSRCDALREQSRDQRGDSGRFRAGGGKTQEIWITDISWNQPGPTPICGRSRWPGRASLDRSPSDGDRAPEARRDRRAVRRDGRRGHLRGFAARLRALAAPARGRRANAERAAEDAAAVLGPREAGRARRRQRPLDPRAPRLARARAHRRRDARHDGVSGARSESTPPSRTRQRCAKPRHASPPRSLRRMRSPRKRGASARSATSR